MQNKTRHLKIFISSTFRDMKEEREILLKETFLELKKIAKERDVEITEIDLRTGITAEQEKNGQIVQICLDEIDRCSESPIFFLGMIGDRYGWNGWYESMDKSILENEKYAWVAEYKNVSVTELEILSALRKNHNRAFIYLKKSKEDEVEKLYWLKKGLERTSQKDKNLKVEFYEDGQEFKEKTIRALKEALDELYPKDREINEVEKLRAVHEAFSLSRQRVYVPHVANEKILDDFTEGEEDKLLLYGESGYGKSALMANYFKRFKERQDVFVIEHYIGSGGEHSSDFYEMLRRVMLEIKEKFSVEDEVPSESQKIVEGFSLWLQKVTSPTVVILDGYNQLDNEIKDKLFYYLPKKLNSVKLIVTSIKDDYPIENKHKIEALNREEQRVLIVNYLASYGKTLDSEIIEKLLTHEQINNTLFLRTVLNEIRLLGNFERLTDDIVEYLKSKDTVGLFIKIFRRLEKDYGATLCRDVLVLVAVSRDGLSETNLMEVIGVNRLKFSTIFLAIEEHLVDRSGLYKFFHAFIEEAVVKQYLFNEALIERERRRIVDYFEEREIDKQKVRELPFQLYALKDRDRLLLSFYSTYFFVAINDEDEYALLKYVRFIGEEFFEVFDRMYKLVLVYGASNRYEIESMANFMKLYGRYDRAMKLYQDVLDLNIEKHGEVHDSVAKSYNNISNTYQSLGKYKESLSFLEKTLEMDKFLGRTDDELSVTYNNLGVIYGSLGEYEKSEEFYRKSLKIRKNFYGEYHMRTAVAYSNLGNLFEKTGKYVEAEEVLLKSLNIVKRLKGEKHLETSEIYKFLGLLYEGTGEHEIAEKFYLQALEIQINILGEFHPKVATLYSNMAALYHRKGVYAKARPYYEKALTIREKSLGKNHSDTATSYSNFAEFLTTMAEYDHAISYSEKALKIWESTLGKNHVNIASIYDRLAKIYRMNREYEKALSYYKKALRIQENTFGENHVKTSTSYNNIALGYVELQEYDKALYFHEKSLKIRKESLGEESYDVGVSYNNMALIYAYQEKYDRAFELYSKFVDILIKTGREKHPTTAIVYYNLGNLFNNTGELEKAKSYLLKSIEIHKKNLSDDHPDLERVRKTLGVVEGKLKR